MHCYSTLAMTLAHTVLLTQEISTSHAHEGTNGGGTTYGDDDDFYVDGTWAKPGDCAATGGANQHLGDGAGADEAWTCAIFGSKSGKAVSGCSSHGGHPRGLPSSRRLSTTGTCPYSGSIVGRLDAGSSNPNGITALQMDKECGELVPNSFPYVSVGGGDYNPMDDTLVMDCR